MDHNKNLVELLQNAEMKAKMSLYYLNQQNNHNLYHGQTRNSVDKSKHPDHHTDEETTELYKAAQIYSRSLEKRLKEKDSELAGMKKKCEEVSRHNDAMLEDLDLLNRKLQEYPNTLQDLRGKLDKMHDKVTLLEEQKKCMEHQASQNEHQVQHSHAIQQDLLQANSYISRLKQYIKSDAKVEDMPVLLSDKSMQTEEHQAATHNVQQISHQLKKYTEDIGELKAMFSDLKEDVTEMCSVNEDMKELEEAVSHMSHQSNHGNSSYSNQSLSVHHLLEVERVEVIGRILPPEKDMLSVYSNNTNNTNLLLKDNNSVHQYTLDLVIPIDAPHTQVLRNVARSCQMLSQGRSVLLLMLGNTELTLYGTPGNPGLISSLIRQMLTIKEEKETLTVSVGTFTNNQLCDGLSGLSDNNTNQVTTVPVTSHQQAAGVLSQANIAEECDYVLHQFTYRNNHNPADSILPDSTTNRSLSLLECSKFGSYESSNVLHEYRRSSKTSKCGKTDALYDIVQAYAAKGAAISVLLNINPETTSLDETSKLLKFAAGVTGVDPTVQNKKKSIFSFRS